MNRFARFALGLVTVSALGACDGFVADDGPAPAHGPAATSAAPVAVQPDLREEALSLASCYVPYRYELDYGGGAEDKCCIDGVVQKCLKVINTRPCPPNQLKVLVPAGHDLCM